jgi:C1A family cysteine protease
MDLRPGPAPVVPPVHPRARTPYSIGRLSTAWWCSRSVVPVASPGSRHARATGLPLLLTLLLVCLLVAAAVLFSGWMWAATARAAGNGIVFAAGGRDARQAAGSEIAVLSPGRTTGHVAPPVALPTAPKVRFASIVRTLPARYTSASAFDLRRGGKVPPVRDQGRWGTCWAFAALGSLESALMPSRSCDLSENNLAAHSGFDLSFNDGGNSRMATAYLARWAGPVAEVDDRYGRPGTSPQGLPERLHVSEVLYLPPRTGPSDNDNVKWAIATYGAIDASMYWDDYCFDPDRATYYYTGTGLNHDVTCVGWDDSYPADRFVIRPPGNGAFLVRNSWGTGFGDGGYCWVSYYDTAFATDAAVFSAASTPDDYAAAYGYDDLGWVDSVGFSASRGTAWFAARYAAVSSGGLSAVAFYTPSPRSDYEVYVGASLDALGQTPVAAGTIAVPGYHTIDLGQRPPVTAGSDFVVAVKLTTPGFAWPVAVERAYQGYASPRTAAGQSFVSPDGRRWSDLGAATLAADVCLKAFTVGETSRVTPPTTVVDSFGGRRGSAARIVFHVAHAAPRTAGVTVTLKIVSGAGRIVERISLADVSTDVSQTVRCTTSLRSGSYRVVASAVDADGHRQTSPLSAKVRLAVAGR